MTLLTAILGQDAPISILRGMLESGRIPHAQLFQGPDGVGKATVARAFAAALLCDSPSPEACGTCPSCLLLKSGGHPDFLAVELLARGASTSGAGARAEAGSADAEDTRKFILVDQIREITRLAGLAPRLGRRRIFIVDPADRMMVAAQNALLKTLEEPPGNAVLILAAARPHLLAATVRSRCFTVRFNALRSGDLAERLEARGMPREEALARAALAEGRPGRALALDLEALAERRREILEVLENLAGSRRELQAMPAMAAALAGKNEATLNEGLDLLQVLIRDAARAAVRADDPALVHGDIAARLERLGHALGPVRASSLVRSVERVRGELRFNVNRTLVAESLLAAVAGGPEP